MSSILLPKILAIVVLGCLVGSALGADTKPATGPATTQAKQEKAVPLSALLDSIPANLKPKPGETPRNKGEREEWIEKNLKGKKATITLTVSAIDTENKLNVGKVQPTPNWTDSPVYVNFTPQKDSIKIYKEDVVVIEGELDQAVLEPKAASKISLVNCKISLKPK